MNTSMLLKIKNVALVQVVESEPTVGLKALYNF